MRCPPVERALLALLISTSDEITKGSVGVTDNRAVVTSRISRCDPRRPRPLWWPVAFVSPGIFLMTAAHAHRQSGTTPAGRAMMDKVQVYTRTGCHLCEAADVDVTRIGGEVGLGYATVGIDAVLTLVTSCPPSTATGSGDRGRRSGARLWRVEDRRLRAALTRP